MINDLYNSSNKSYKRQINPIDFRNYSKENNNKINKRNESLNNKFIDERMVTHFTHKYIKKDMVESQNKNSSSNNHNITKYIDMYKDIDVQVNKGRNSSKNTINTILNDAKYSLSKLNGPRCNVASSNHIDSLKKVLESESIQNKAKLQSIELILPNRNENIQKRNNYEERFFSIMPTNDIDLKQVRLNKSYLKQVINTK